MHRWADSDIDKEPSADHVEEEQSEEKSREDHREDHFDEPSKEGDRDAAEQVEAENFSEDHAMSEGSEVEPDDVVSENEDGGRGEGKAKNAPDKSELQGDDDDYEIMKFYEENAEIIAEWGSSERMQSLVFDSERMREPFLPGLFENDEAALSEEDDIVIEGEKSEEHNSHEEIAEPDLDEKSQNEEEALAGEDRHLEKGKVEQEQKLPIAGKEDCDMKWAILEQEKYDDEVLAAKIQDDSDIEVEEEDEQEHDESARAQDNEHSDNDDVVDGSSEEGEEGAEQIPALNVVGGALDQKIEYDEELNMHMQLAIERDLKCTQGMYYSGDPEVSRERTLSWSHLLASQTEQRHLHFLLACRRTTCVHDHDNFRSYCMQDVQHMKVRVVNMVY